VNIKSEITLPHSVFVQEIDDETIILDSVSQEYFSLNEIGKVIWNLLSQSIKLEDIKIQMLEMYEVEEFQLENDILNFIKALKEKGLIKVD
jgi:hypothetical protein